MKRMRINWSKVKVPSFFLRSDWHILNAIYMFVARRAYSQWEERRRFGEINEENG